MRFGLLDGGELDELRARSVTLNDLSVYEERHTDGTPSWLRDRLHLWRFPLYRFASLVKGGFVFRWGASQDRLSQTIATRGQYAFGTATGSDAVAAEGSLRQFVPLPILDSYLRSLLSEAREHGIAVYFLAMPVNEPTAKATAAEVTRDFAAYWSGLAERFDNLRVVSAIAPAWPNHLFGDGFSHLNAEGALIWSERLSACANNAWSNCDFAPPPSATLKFADRSQRIGGE
jgi:hypothetical protein